MKAHATQVRDVAAYTLLATLPVISLAWFASARGGLAAVPMVAPLAMSAPALAAIVVQKATSGRLLGPDGLGLRMGRVSWWFGGLLAFATLSALAFVVTAFIDPVAVANGAELRDAIAGLKGLPDLGSPMAQALGALALTVLVAPFLNLPLYLGEELGWRGFLAPRLTALLGRRGVLVTGVIWGLWHLPIILLGYNYGSQPLAGLLVWIPLCMSLSVLLTALRNAGGAIWPAALAHGALNQTATLLTGTVLVSARFTPLVDGAAGLAGLLVFGSAAAVIYLRYGHVLDISSSTAVVDKSPTLVAA